MPFIQFHCPFCNKKSTSESYFDCANERIHSLSCGHSNVETLVQKLGSSAADIRSLDNRALLPFQVKGVEFAENSNIRCLIADEMRLGKTVQALTTMKLHPECFPVAIICKSALKFQWAREVMRWCGIEYITQIIESSKDFILPNAKFYIFSFDILRRFNGKITETFEKLGIKTLIVDECQQIKNTGAKRTLELRNLTKATKYMLALSGTPIKNNADEYFSILNMLKPEHFISYDGFRRTWVDSFWDGFKYKMGGLRNPKRFQEYTKDFIIRREREDVMPELPKINRDYQFHDLGTFVLEAYEKQEKALIQYAETSTDSAFEKGSNILAMMARMRHLTGLSKVDNAAEFAFDFLSSNERKLTLFVRHKDVGKLLMDKIGQICKAANIKEPLAFTADLGAEQRNEVIEKFLYQDYRILVASIEAAGEGLTLETCSDCVIVERLWNPANEEQAEARFIHISKPNEVVMATYLVAIGTIDEYLTEIIERKRAIFANTMKGEDYNWDETSIIQELTQVLIAKGKEKWKL